MLFSQLICLSGVIAIASAVPLQAAATGECKLRWFQESIIPIRVESFFLPHERILTNEKKKKQFSDRGEY